MTEKEIKLNNLSTIKIIKNDTEFEINLSIDLKTLKQISDMENNNYIGKIIFYFIKYMFNTKYIIYFKKIHSQ